MNVCIMTEMSLKFVLKGPVNKKSGNGLVPNRQQAITWTDVDPYVWSYMVSLGHNELNKHDDKNNM